MTSRALRVAPIVLVCITTNANASLYSDAVLANGPVGYYRLNETTGTTAANSGSAGSAIDGTYIIHTPAPEGTGPIHFNQAGPRPGDASGAGTIVGFESDNKAIHSRINFVDPFPTNGGNPRVEVLDTVGNPLDITGALTLEAWIYRDPQTDGFNGNNEGIISKWNGGTPGQRAFNLVYRPVGNHIRFLTSNTGLSIGAYDFPTPDNVIPLGVWTHVAATYIPSTRSALFINGNLVAERTDPAGIPPSLFDSAAPLWIGNQFTTTDPLHPFEGKVDEAAIYNEALTDAQILAHYREAVIPEPATGSLVLAAACAAAAASRFRQYRCRAATGRRTVAQ